MQTEEEEEGEGEVLEETRNKKQERDRLMDGRIRMDGCTVLIQVLTYLRTPVRYYTTAAR